MARTVMRVVAPRAGAIAIFIVVWQALVLTKWKPEFLLPSPFTVLDALVHDPGAFAHDAGVSLARAAIGLGFGLLAGGVIGLLAAVARPLRSSLRSMVRGLETLPAVVWFPAALIVAGPTNPVTILVVGAIAAAPPIARGVIDGVAGAPARAAVDPVPRLEHARRVVLPGMLPDALAGLRTGWLACWTAILAGEILLTLPSLGLGGLLAFDRGLNDNVAVYEGMIVVFLVGVVVDGLLFGGAAALLRRRGAHPAPTH